MSVRSSACASPFHVSHPIYCLRLPPWIDLHELIIYISHRTRNGTYNWGEYNGQKQRDGGRSHSNSCYNVSAIQFTHLSKVICLFKFLRSFFTANRSGIADLRDTAAPDLVLAGRTVRCKNVLLGPVQEIWSVLSRRLQALELDFPGQRLYKEVCYFMARCNGDFMALISKMEEGRGIWLPKWHPRAVWTHLSAREVRWRIIRKRQG